MSSKKNLITNTYFGLSDFFVFLKNNNIYSIALATVISRYIYILSMGFIDHLIMPIINRDGNKDGIKDIKQLQDYILTIFGIHFELGAFIVLVIKFILIICIMYLLSKIIDKSDITVLTT